MENNLSRYHADSYVNEIMGETWEKGKDYDSTLSCRFNIAECLRWRFDQETVGQVGNLVSVEIPGK